MSEQTPPASPEDDILTLEESAHLAGVSVKTVRRALAAGVLTVHYASGPRGMAPHVGKGDLLSWIATRAEGARVTADPMVILGAQLGHMGSRLQEHGADLEAMHAEIDALVHTIAALRSEIAALRAEREPLALPPAEARPPPVAQARSPLVIRALRIWLRRL